MANYKFVINNWYSYIVGLVACCQILINNTRILSVIKVPLILAKYNIKCHHICINIMEISAIQGLVEQSFVLGKIMIIEFKMYNTSSLIHFFKSLFYSQYEIIYFNLNIFVYKQYNIPYQINYALLIGHQTKNII